MFSPLSRPHRILFVILLIVGIVGGAAYAIVTDKSSFTIAWMLIGAIVGSGAWAIIVEPQIPREDVEKFDHLVLFGSIGFGMLGGLILGLMSGKILGVLIMMGIGGIVGLLFWVALHIYLQRY